MSFTKPTTYASRYSSYVSTIAMGFFKQSYTKKVNWRVTTGTFEFFHFPREDISAIHRNKAQRHGSSYRTFPGNTPSHKILPHVVIMFIKGCEIYAKWLSGIRAPHAKLPNIGVIWSNWLWLYQPQPLARHILGKLRFSSSFLHF